MHRRSKQSLELFSLCGSYRWCAELPPSITKQNSVNIRLLLSNHCDSVCNLRFSSVIFLVSKVWGNYCDRFCRLQYILSCGSWFTMLPLWYKRGEYFWIINIPASYGEFHVCNDFEQVSWLQRTRNHNLKITLYFKLLYDN